MNQETETVHNYTYIRYLLIYQTFSKSPHNLWSYIKNSPYPRD